MKTLTVLLIGVMLAIGGVCYAEFAAPEEEKAEEAKPPAPFLCPGSKVSDNNKCMVCHQMVLRDGKPAFGLKEVLIESNYEEKPFGLKIMSEHGQLAGYYYLTDIRPSVLEEIKRYLYENPEIKKLIIDIHSPGGSVMGAWKIVGVIEEMRTRGIEIETRCYGLAASAGGIILVAGDIGKRSVNPHAEIMVHKLWQFSMFSVDDPDSSEDKTEMLKHFQKNINDFFEKRTNLTHQILDDRTFHKMWWLTGAEAVELGIADRLIQ
jgi:ATP-dependent Clp protease protease subunit